MSYDVTLHDPDTGEELFWANHTSNTAQMWRDGGCDLSEFDGKKARELAEALSPAILDIVRRRSHHEQYEPLNRWGSRESTLKFLRDIEQACYDYPDANVEVSR